MMTSNKINLVVIPFHDWKKCEQEGFRTRDAHFMQEFGKHPQIKKLLVINRPLSWAEMLLLRRRRYPKSGQLISQQGKVYLSQVGEKTYTLDIVIPEVLRPLWMKRSWIPYIFAKSRIAREVNKALPQLEIDSRYAMFLSAPLFVPLVQNLTPDCWAFDAQDNLLKQTLYRSVPALKQYYDFCLAHAHFISANSAETTKWFQETRPDAQWISNGVDTDMFSPHRAYPLPTDMQSITPPIIGYAGKMQEMFDMQAIKGALAALPEINFVFIGQQLNQKWIKEIWQYPNAHYLGDKSYHLLPQYLAAFDICIIPYSLQRQHGGDPIKFYEYLAMGKPIVSAEIGGVDVFKDYQQVCITRNAEEFIAGLQQMVLDVKDGKRIETRPVPAEYLWKSKADQIVQAIIHGRSAPQA